ncbi:MAG: S-layer homology domain-containing protein [Candidatus Gracilibacteria bacterium]|nr:S-layer homology domain-containing protein [Candidatus Gracilibacteria bacterium]
MKKLILSLLTLSLLGGLFTFLPAGASRNFPDVNQVHPYFQAVETLALRGVVDGYPDGYFRPDNPVSRVEALKIAMLASQKNVRNLEGDVNFPDVPTDAWYAPYIERAQNDGIIKGFSDGFFYPDQKITYMEALKIIMKLNGILEDYEPEGDLWFLPYLKIANDYKILDPIMARKPEVLARQNHILASWISRGEMSYLAFEIWSKRDILSVKARTLHKALAYKPSSKYEDIELETENNGPDSARETQIVGKYERAQRVAQEDFDSIITQRGIDLAKKAYQLAAYEPGVMQFWPYAFQETNLTLEEWYMMKISNILKRKEM